MRIEDLKRWHWIALGLILGALLAYVQIGVGPDAWFHGYESISQQEFETALAARPLQGNPILSDIVVYPAGKVDFVAARLLASADRNNPASRTRVYKSVLFHAPHPYSPIQANEATNLRLNPDWFTPQWGNRNRIKLIGWQQGKGQGGGRDPADGSSIEFPLLPGAYEVTVSLLGGGKPGQLKASMNGHDLPGFQAVKDNLTWTTTIPASAVVAGKPQVLKFVRQGGPFRIREVQVVAPAFGIVDYLQDMKKANAALTWKNAWWSSPRAMLILWTVGTTIVVGGIWPFVVRFLIGAGFGRPAKEPAYDLSRFKGEPAAAAAPEPAPADDAAWEQMKTELLKDLEDSPVEPPTEDPVGVPVAAPIPKLTAGPLEIAPAPDNSADATEFDGEFYPVARPHGHSHV